VILGKPVEERMGAFRLWNVRPEFIDLTSKMLKLNGHPGEIHGQYIKDARRDSGSVTLCLQENHWAYFSSRFFLPSRPAFCLTLGWLS
jgi:hypothetical protein